MNKDLTDDLELATRLFMDSLREAAGAKHIAQAVFVIVDAKGETTVFSRGVDGDESLLKVLKGMAWELKRRITTKEGKPS